MKKIKILLIIIIAMITSCKNNKQVDNDKIQIYTSIYPMYDFTKKIVNDKANVINIVGPGEEPHHFEINTKDMAKIINADLIIYNGGGMEHWIESLIEAQKNLKTINTSQNIIEENDPHFWLSPKKAKIQMQNIKNAVVEIDFENSEYYNSNYNFYAKKLDELDEKIKNSLQNITNRYLVVTHPAFSHFAEEYNFKEIAISRDEADLKRVADIINFIKTNNIKAIFVEEFSNDKLIQSVANETGANIFELNPIEALSEEYKDEDYFSIMEKNLTSITNALF